MNITFLGTCAGTEPMPMRKHMSFAIESQHRIYWFDAGEGCSYTAHLMGVDLLSVNKIIISHTHMDHVGGLGNLLWNIRKLSIVKSTLPHYGDIDVYIPNMETWDGILKILKNSEGGFKTDFDVNAHPVTDGVLFDDGVLKVTAYHNHHLRDHNFEPWLSYTYKIECENKCVVYSGDVGEYEDMDAPLSNGCAALIVETGHLSISGVYNYVRDKNVDKIFFNHNGREILNNEDEAAKKINDLFNGSAVICKDKTTVEI